MKNQYFGDVGDFGKYGIIRHLINNVPDVRIGVNWFLTKNDIRTDGKHIDYLTKSAEFRECDPELYNFLQESVTNNLRSIRQIEDSALLGNTLFYSDLLDYSEVKGHLQKRIDFRVNWFANSMDRLIGSHIIYVDPDNGLEVKSQSIYGPNGVKYISYDEIRIYFESGFSIIVYNHRDRRPYDQYINRFRCIYDLVDAELVCLRFLRYSVRDYVFVLHHDIAKTIKYALETFIQTPWGNCFQLYQIEPRGGVNDVEQF